MPLYNPGEISNSILAWETGKRYGVGDDVAENDKLYSCLVAHTSGTFATDLAASKWGEISAGASNLNELTDSLIETNSLWVGNSPTATTNNAQYNVAVGTTSLDSITTGDKNVSIGYNALTSSTTGFENVAIGHKASEGTTATNYGVFVGCNAGLTGSGPYNVAVGHNAGYTMGTTSTGNTLIGRSAGASINSGTYNTLLGFNAGDNLTTGDYNIILGYGVDASAVGVDNELRIGKQSVIAIGANLATGAVTFNSAFTFPTSDGNANEVLQTNGSGAISWSAISVNNGNWSGTDLAILNGGTGASTPQAAIDALTAVSGAATGEVLTKDGSGNATWAAAGGGGASDLDGLADVEVVAAGGTAEQYSIFLSNGLTAGGTPQHGTLSTAMANLAIGPSALAALTQGDYNVALGYRALKNITTGGFNTSTGYNSLGNTTGAGNTAVGYNAGGTNTSGSYNTYIGGDMGGVNTGQYQIGIGWGVYAGGSNTFALGKTSKTLLHGEFGTTGATKLGINLGNTWQTPSATLHVKGQGNTNGTTSFLVESTNKTLMRLYDSGDSIRIGANAGHTSANAANISIGGSSCFYPSGANNVSIGNGALTGTSTANSNGNVAVGHNALNKVIDARTNVVIGQHAGYEVTGGDRNTIVGGYSGDNLTTGSDNIIIGYNVDASSATVSNELNIGGQLIGSMATSGDRYSRFVGQVYTTNSSGVSPHPLTDAATITPDFKNGNVQTVELAGNRTIANPTNIKAGATYIIIVKQDGTGSRTVTWGSKYKFPGGTIPTLTTTGGKADVITVVAYSTDILMCTSTLDFATS